MRLPLAKRKTARRSLVCLFRFSIIRPLNMLRYAFLIMTLVAAARATEMNYYLSTTDFTNMCTNGLSGVTIGPRCYFLPLASNHSGVAYLDAVAACVKVNATLAHIHTEEEYQGVNAYTMNRVTSSNYGAVVAMSLIDELTSMGPGKYLIANTTRWKDPVDSLLIPAMNTYARVHRADNDESTGQVPRCIGIYQGEEFFDWEYDVANFIPLCQVVNGYQGFSLIASCIDEVPALSFPACTPKECAQTCAVRIWCHSFNFVQDPDAGCQPQCQLFTWSVKDPTCKSTGCAKTVVKDDCYTYNVI